MANKNRTTNSNDILVKVDQNNLIYIDPNTVLSDGKIKQRQVEPENLVMFVNLQADLIPRTTFIASNQQNTLFSVAEGMLNMVQNADGTDFDTRWTDSFLEYNKKKELKNSMTNEFYQSDKTAQTFGIENIKIEIKGTNFVPRVTINFVDVRGKTLFESPENSPYKAFFHLPWPIFYLTIKGYYGKPIRYRLHLVSFNSKMNSENGNFEIETTFVGSTYAYLTDIPLDGILNAPYMYGIDSEENDTYNEKTETYDRKIKKTSHGYITLKSVYQEYISKGLLPEDFPVKTVREVGVIARSLDKILENELFSQIVDYNVLAGIKEFSNDITNFVTALKEWKKKNLSVEVLYDGGVNERYLKLKYNETSEEKITDVANSGTLAFLIQTKIDKLNNNQAFGINKTIDNKNKKVKTKSISFNSLSNIKDFYVFRDSKYGVNVEKILSRLLEIEKDFAEQSKTIQETVQKEMNIVIKDPSKGIGFEPTIRNLVGVVLANADTYIRLLKEVHTNAFNIAEQRKSIIQGFSSESVGSAIYPWPEIKKKVEGKKNNVLAYPGSLDLLTKLRSNDRRLWPEVEFVEEFLRVQTKKIDVLESGDDVTKKVNFIFESDSEFANIKDISTLTYLSNILPYYNKTVASILYEIWERGKYCTTVDSFNNKVIRELAELDYENFEKQIIDDYDLIEILKDKIKSVQDLEESMIGFSPFERYPYLQDQLPTVPYIQSVLEDDFRIEKFVKQTKGVSKLDSYPYLKENLFNYTAEPYRSKIYPFNSSLYLSYIGKTEFTKDELKLNDILQVDTKDGFITSPISPEMWVNSSYIQNLFDNKLKVGLEYKHILNTPYFHRQLYTDFFNQKFVAQYAGSAYLLLNSLPFKDLDDIITYDKKSVRMSTMFKEVGATHFIPFHLMLKWGSIYHRYKEYLLNGNDIIENITVPIDSDLFFDSNNGRTYDLSGTTVDRTTQTNIGLNPYYQSIFHQIVNGYSFYNPISGSTSYSEALSNDAILNTNKIMDGNLAWTSLVDNSKFDSTDNRYTLLPSNGFTNYTDLNDYLRSEQENYRILWYDNNPLENVGYYSGQTFPSYDQYFRDILSDYTISGNNKKVIDLIATFKSDILDEFETMFIDFSSKLLNEDVPYKPYDVTHYNFQSLLKELTTVEKLTTDSFVIDQLVRDTQKKQKIKLENITSDILSNNNLIKFTLSNPKEIENYYLGGYIDFGVENFSITTFDSVKNTDLIELYLGEDLDGYYTEFFSVSDIEMSEDNIKNFRFLIQIYAGYRNTGGSADKTSFVTYIRNNITHYNNSGYSSTQGQRERFKLYLKTFIGAFDLDNLLKDTNRRELTIDIGFNEDPIKLEQYNYFKSFNDKWVAGNSLGQKTLMEEFLFLDKANKDIGDEAFIDMKKIADLLSQPNKNKMSLFNVINLIIKNTGFDIRVLPAYVNFYGSNFTNRNKITPSSTVAENLFGTFLDVDFEKSSPKVLLQYVGQVSNHLDLTNISEKYKFKDDGVDISSPDNNPVIITPEAFRNTDFSKSNRVVAFEVSFGDQNQSLFSNLQLDQNSVKNTSESFEVLERLGNSQAGSSTSQIDIGLYDIYRQVSYSCGVTSMGNVMIQPTMYFQLKNVPLFKGSYWITEVTHSISPGKFETTFTGSRIPLKSLPDPKESFTASYRTLFDNLISKAQIKVNEENLATTTNENTTQAPDGSTSTAIMSKELNFDIQVLEDSGVTDYSMPYHGYGGKNQGSKLVKIGGEEWIAMNFIEINTGDYKIPDNTVMNIITKNNYYSSLNPITWRDIKFYMIQNNTPDLDFYFANFNFSMVNMSSTIDRYSISQFMNPNDLTTNIELINDYNYDNNEFIGPINNGISNTKYCIALSSGLMKKLNLYNSNQVVYFRMIAAY